MTFMRRWLIVHWLRRYQGKCMDWKMFRTVIAGVLVAVLILIAAWGSFAYLMMHYWHWNTGIVVHLDQPSKPK